MYASYVPIVNTIVNIGYRTMQSAGASVCVSLHSLMIHASDHSTEEILFNRDLFNNLSEGDYVQLYDPDRPTERLVLKVPPIRTQPTAGRMEVSLNKSLAELLRLKPFQKIAVERPLCEKNEYAKGLELDFAEFGFKKQFLQRGNMWRIKTS